MRFSTDDQGANQLPLEVVTYVTNATEASRSCQLWVRFPTYASGTREVYMFYKKTGETQPAVGAAFGRNAVWQDYIGVYHCEDSNYTDSSGNQDLALAGSNAPSVIAGVIGNSYQFSSGDSTNLKAAMTGISHTTLPISLHAVG